MAFLVLFLFLSGLGFCIATGTDILYALIFGLFCFSSYAYLKGFRGKALLRLLWEGLAKLRNILIIFALLGVLTGLWRACGTIPYIVYSSVSWIDHRFIALWAFLLCCLMSLLTGSALCSSSIMGVILMLLARSSGTDPLLTGGAVIAGSYFGDRCSPMSSSANLVCALTETKYYDNLRNMLRSAALPFLLTVAGYILLSLSSAPKAADKGIVEGLAGDFILRWPVVLPAAAIVLLSLFRINVKIIMCVSILLSAVLGVAVQGLGAGSLLRAAVLGYSGSGAAARLLAGGGLRSMLHVSCIVILSSTYLGIFRATGLLNGFAKLLGRLCDILSPYTATVLLSFPVAALSCNQSLGIMLTTQLCRDCFEEKEKAALAVEDSVVLTAALIPWNIAAAAPLAFMGIGAGSLKYALFLYILPLMNGAVRAIRHRAGKKRGRASVNILTKELRHDHH